MILEMIFSQAQKDLLWVHKLKPFFLLGVNSDQCLNLVVDFTFEQNEY